MSSRNWHLFADDCCLGDQTTKLKASRWILCDSACLMVMVLVTKLTPSSHHMWTIALDGKLHLAPISSDIKVCLCYSAVAIMKGY